ncbi:MAG: hypothetical protein VR70_10830 [Rhodospirillaceae bacterium BRH_c57]|nr:MAG: hypothetical protein VR70_10830 [Rhodospirillaceae bacterium BRH_c57]
MSNVKRYRPEQIESDDETYNGNHIMFSQRYDGLWWLRVNGELPLFAGSKKGVQKLAAQIVNGGYAVGNI